VGPYPQSSFDRGYNDGFFGGVKNDPYYNRSPESRGYNEGFEYGFDDANDDGDHFKGELRLRENETDQGVVLDITTSKPSFESFEDVRGMAYAEGEFDQEKVDINETNVDYWINWVNDNFSYPSEWSEQQAQVAYNGYQSGLQASVDKTLINGGQDA